MRRTTAFFGVLMLGVLVPGFAAADAVAEARAALAAHKHAAMEARAEARAQAARAALLAEQQIEAAAALRGLEDQTGQDAETLADLQARQQAAGRRLVAAQAALGALLPVMQRLSAQPEAALLAMPEPPGDAVRGVAIMQGIAASIAVQAQAVQTETRRLAGLVSAAQAAQARLAAAAATQQAAEGQLSVEIDAAKADEMQQADTAARETEASLAAQAKLDTLNAAIARLVPRAGAPALPEGAGAAPVAGRIVQNYGASTLAGPAEGVSYDAAPGARVTTPCAGTVMFAGSFPAYGLMVIADCGQGTSLVLAGMAHLDVATGERLARGQPIGSMLGYNPQDPAHLPVLYVELRQNGHPVDPAGWLRAAR
ncbi:MAG: peptidoglycan DD-metalloendopeptidase family protein [Acidocella sp.]|nr:peptidoglycan DD-metalloendopeptidase family protein [Acidocella sp.]